MVDRVSYKYHQCICIHTYLNVKECKRCVFLNQVRAGAWFLRIVPVRMYACVRPRGY